MPDRIYTRIELSENGRDIDRTIIVCDCYCCHDWAESQAGQVVARVSLIDQTLFCERCESSAWLPGELSMESSR
jgi:hypothetical protein